jgi:hypothetical protein
VGLIDELRLIAEVLAIVYPVYWGFARVYSGFARILFAGGLHGLQWVFAWFTVKVYSQGLQR